MYITMANPKVTLRKRKLKNGYSYQLDYTINGRGIRKSVGKNKAQAQEIRDKLQTDITFGNLDILIIKPKTISIDKFEISTIALKGKTVNYNSDKINVWPNPYFAINPEEKSTSDRQIHFTNLPVDGNCIIRIFDLAGNLVRQMNHTNGTQFEIWNVRDYHSNPVASGMYIAHIETENGQKILKLAVIQPSN